MLGPLSKEDLASRLRDGRLTAGDFVQSGDLPLWQPLANVVEDKADKLSGAVVPDWNSILALVRLRLRYHLGEQTVGTGLICLLTAAVVLVISRWPVIFWAPWLVGTIGAAVILIRRRRELTGTLLLLGVLAVPFTHAYFQTRTLRREVEGAMASRGGSISPARTAPPAGSGESLHAAATIPAKSEAVASSSSSPVPAPAESAAAAPSEPPAAPAPAAGNVPAVVSQTPATLPEAGGPAARPVPPWERPPAPWEKSPALLGANPPQGVTAPDLVQSHNDAFIIIKGKEGSGSGFICRDGTRTWLYTNIHVAADLQQPTFTRLGNSAVVPGAAEAAGGPDIVRFALPEAPGHPLELMTEVDNNVRIGDEVVVLGNSGGGGVVTNLKGEVRGIGPDRLEVTAEFIPGNSGSPIVHVKTGKVIGIATYLTRRYDEFAPKSANPPSNTPAPYATPRPRSPGVPGGVPPSTPTPRTGPKGEGAIVVRRFGYRIDTVARWEPVNWPAFRAEAKQVEEVSRLTEDIVGFLGSLRARSVPQYKTETLRRPATLWLERVRSKQVSETDRVSATQRFLGQLRSMVRNDIQATEASLRYAYFRNDLQDERQVRDQLYEAFDAESTALASPVGRPGYH